MFSLVRRVIAYWNKMAEIHFHQSQMINDSIFTELN